MKTKGSKHASIPFDWVYFMYDHGIQNFNREKHVDKKYFGSTYASVRNWVRDGLIPLKAVQHYEKNKRKKLEKYFLRNRGNSQHNAILD